jgi:hypothetical protein
MQGSSWLLSPEHITAGSVMVSDLKKLASMKIFPLVSKKEVSLHENLPFFMLQRAM